MTSLSRKSIIQARESLDLSQARFAALMGVSQPTISAWEARKGKPTAHQSSILGLILETNQTQERKAMVSNFLDQGMTASAMFAAMGGLVP